jgi:hypothetical protein
MDTRLTQTSKPGTLQPGRPLPPSSQIALALTSLAAHRGGEWEERALAVVVDRLSREPFEDVIVTLQSMADTPRGDHETAIPSTGAILLAVRSLSHPQRHLRELVAKLARIFGVTPDEELFGLYEETAGRRTDKDMDAAYKTLREDPELRRMPTPAQFLAACGIPNVYRDGTRPE